MCIRDSKSTIVHSLLIVNTHDRQIDQTVISESRVLLRIGRGTLAWINTCLLYTSDAADERSSVDLGGRRIIKKKKNNHVFGYSK